MNTSRHHGLSLPLSHPLVRPFILVAFSPAPSVASQRKLMLTHYCCCPGCAGRCGFDRFCPDHQIVNTLCFPSCASTRWGSFGLERSTSGWNDKNVLSNFPRTEESPGETPNAFLSLVHNVSRDMLNISLSVFAISSSVAVSSGGLCAATSVVSSFAPPIG